MCKNLNGLFANVDPKVVNFQIVQKNTCYFYILPIVNLVNALNFFVDILDYIF